MQPLCWVYCVTTLHWPCFLLSHHLPLSFLLPNYFAVSFCLGVQVRFGLHWKHVHPPRPSQDDSGIPAFCFSQHLCWYYWPSPLFSNCCDVLGIVLYWYLLLCIVDMQTFLEMDFWQIQVVSGHGNSGTVTDVLFFPLQPLSGGLMWRWDPQIPSWE